MPSTIVIVLRFFPDQDEKPSPYRKIYPLEPEINDSIKAPSIADLHASLIQILERSRRLRDGLKFITFQFEPMLWQAGWRKGLVSRALDKTRRKRVSFESVFVLPLSGWCCPVVLRTLSKEENWSPVGDKRVERSYLWPLLRSSPFSDEPVESGPIYWLFRVMPNQIGCNVALSEGHQRGSINLIMRARNQKLHNSRCRSSKRCNHVLVMRLKYHLINP